MPTPMTHQKNNRYLDLLWVLSSTIALIFVLGAVHLSVNAAAGGGYALPLVFAGGGLAIAISVWLHARWRARRRVERAFLQREPEELLRALRPGGSESILNGEAFEAYLNAWVCALYGRFDSARDALARVEWKLQPPIVRAAATSVEALLCFFDTRELARGLKLACTARAAAGASGNFPGGKTAMQGYDSLVEIGRVLTNKSEVDTIANLRSQAQTLPIGGRLIATWGLAAAYSRAGDGAQANETLARCTELAPYCEPLCSLPSPIRVAPTSLPQNDPEPLEPPSPCGFCDRPPVEQCGRCEVVTCIEHGSREEPFCGICKREFDDDLDLARVGDGFMDVPKTKYLFLYLMWAPYLLLMLILRPLQRASQRRAAMARARQLFAARSLIEITVWRRNAGMTVRGE